MAQLISNPALFQQIAVTRSELLRMRLVIALAAFFVTGCGQMQLSCSPTDHVRASVNGRGFVIPVDLKPGFIGAAAEHSPLPSFIHRDDRGRWAYCQKASEPPVLVYTFSFYGDNVGATFRG